MAISIGFSNLSQTEPLPPDLFTWTPNEYLVYIEIALARRIYLCGGAVSWDGASSKAPFDSPGFRG